jgi:hypothetical protein
LHGEAIELCRALAAHLPQQRTALVSVEAWVGEVAEYQTLCLKQGAQSLWHRDQT